VAPGLLLLMMMMQMLLMGGHGGGYHAGMQVRNRPIVGSGAWRAAVADAEGAHVGGH
jgi:hypothetical protein